jgi:hypothetical protein
VDGDGKDELLAGQTNSSSSLTQFTVIDLDDPQHPIRHNYTAFPEGFRGDGGVELCVVDLDGDGKKEIVAANKGKRGDEPGNRISVMIPIVENQQIVGFGRPSQNQTLEVMAEALNPGGGMYISAGEFDGVGTGTIRFGLKENGGEIIVGSGEGAPQSFFHLFKVIYNPNIGAFGTLTSGNFLTGSIGEINNSNIAFLNQNTSYSGAVSVGCAEILRWHLPGLPEE